MNKIKLVRVKNPPKERNGYKEWMKYERKEREKQENQEKIRSNN